LRLEILKCLKILNQIFLEAWGVPEHVDQVRDIDSMVYTLRNRQLRGLTQEAMVMIEDEGERFRKLAQLGDLIQGEDIFNQDMDFKDVPEDVLDAAISSVQVRFPSFEYS
jgi:hypothetical protein